MAIPRGKQSTEEQSRAAGFEMGNGNKWVARPLYCQFVCTLMKCSLLLRRSFSGNQLKTINKTTTKKRGRKTRAQSRTHRSTRYGAARATDNVPVILLYSSPSSFLFPPPPTLFPSQKNIRLRGVRVGFLSFLIYSFL